MKNLVFLALVLLACEKEGVFNEKDASSATRGSFPSLDAGLQVVEVAQVSPDTYPISDKSDVRAVDTIPTLPDVSPALDLIPKPDLSPPDLPGMETLSRDTAPDLIKIDLQPDTTPLTLGKECSKGSDCRSNFCTNGVCCEVEKCVDTCVPGPTFSCAPYTGFTCAPLGTCRGF